MSISLKECRRCDNAVGDRVSRAVGRLLSEQETGKFCMIQGYFLSPWALEYLRAARLEVCKSLRGLHEFTKGG